ncbi:MAG: xanthine dehydrogenase family protein subunit M [Desulfobacteraceae bacterium]|nr:xanthine dehydrogenase family protein subunit M [Desulfobacteraceae bacterium]
MKKFAHLNARTLEEAVSFLGSYGGKAEIIAGGTDLLGKMKDEILPNYPEALINIKTITDLDYIEETGQGLRIGALTRLNDIAEHSGIREKYTALAQAAERTASPHIREMGTLSGNICQDIRCWYYRNPNNRFPCLRKGGGRCYAIEGDNRYHSIFGGTVEKGCYAVHPSDMAPALIALNASVKTSKRTIKSDEFFKTAVRKTTVLDRDEIVTEFEFPAPAKGSKSHFIKFAIRKSIDFPIVNCATSIINEAGKVKEARICLNGVYIKPYRAAKAEEDICGKTIDEETADAAAQTIVSEARPMKDNAYMVQIARTLVKRTILACKE